MASTLKVDNLQTQDGDSYNVVSWDTTAKTAAFTAVSGKGYFVDTSSAAITVTLPASPSAGDIVALQDYAGTWVTNNVTVARNGSNIGGLAADATLSTSNQSITLVYVDGTRGWQTVNDSTQNIDGAEYIVASGGTETTCGDYKYHTFSGPGTFTVTNAGNPLGSTTVDYLVVAGGGSGGSRRAGGGGAGGLRQITCESVSVQAYPVAVGAGGTGVASGPDKAGNAGSNSSFSTTTSAGGGAGGQNCQTGNSGGSGSGGGSAFPTGSNAGGSGNTPPVSPPQGNDGGTGGAQQPGNLLGGGGGGGAGAVGGNASGSSAGDGGAGLDVSPNFPATLGGSPAGNYAGGGGGGGQNISAGAGGTGGGSAGSTNSPSSPSGSTSNAVANTGGGSGAMGSPSSGSTGNGGSGIVIIKYKYQ